MDISEQLKCIFLQLNDIKASIHCLKTCILDKIVGNIDENIYEDYKQEVIELLNEAKNIKDVKNENIWSEIVVLANQIQENNAWLQ
jgi:hypothetical protein